MKIKGIVIGLIATGIFLCQDSARALEKINLITDFGFNGRHAFFFVALDKNYYRDAGLDVQIVRGQGSVDAIRQVGAKNAFFGFADAGSLVLSRANDNAPLKMVAVVYARPPQAIYCMEGAGVEKPKDLEGKSIANPAGGSTVDIFPAYAKAAGIDASKVRWVIANSDSLPGILVTGAAPCIGQFVVGEALISTQILPKKLVKFSYSDPGLKYYGNGIITSEETINTNPDLVRRFVAATIKGMRDAFADPQMAGAIINKYHRFIDPRIGAAETEAVAKLADVPGVSLGKIEEAKAEETIGVMKNAFTFKSPVHVKDVFATGFVPD
jgi:NitT/TauT family transport system substrate-binding protein